MNHKPKNIKLTIEYDGTRYHGWQSQAGTGARTIQETVELAINRLTGEYVKILSSGRTDAGVHAFGHVASFKTECPIPSGAWAPALNHLLPNDIRVLSSESVADDFHARYSARGKIYAYKILNRYQPTALHRDYAWHVHRRLNLRTIRLAASALIGKHDFSAFRGSGCNARSPVRIVRSVVVKRRGDIIEIWIEADAFLKYMMRNIVGTLVEVGLGRFKPQDVHQLLVTRDRTKAGRTAPPQGLYLIKVLYE